MFASSSQGVIAVAPTLPQKSIDPVLFLQHNDLPAPQRVVVPSCFKDAQPMAQTSSELLNDDDEKNGPNDKSRLVAIQQKKNTPDPHVRGLHFTADGKYLGVALESYIFLLYEVILTSDNGVVTKIETKLIHVAMLVRHLSYITTTPHNNDKYFLIADSLGTLYALALADLLASPATVSPQLLFSEAVNFTVLDTFGVTLNNVKKFFLLTADCESKVRVSNLPHFFDIQAFCQGQRDVTTAIAVVPNIIENRQSPDSESVLLVSASGYGFEREKQNTITGPWKEYFPSHISFTLHNVLSAQLSMLPRSFDFSQTFPAAIEESSTSFFNLVTLIPSVPTADTPAAIVVGSPTNVACWKSPSGHTNLGHAHVTRSSLAQLAAFAVQTSSTTPSIDQLSVSLDLNNNDQNLANELIDVLAPVSSGQNVFHVLTMTRKIITLSSKQQPIDGVITIQIERVVTLPSDDKDEAAQTETEQKLWSPSHLSIARSLYHHFAIACRDDNDDAAAQPDQEEQNENTPSTKRQKVNDTSAE